jgi:SAM-dependent methyltransferase
VYVHGTSPEEQRRLARLNEMMNTASLAELLPVRGTRILDVGSGLGQLTRAMARAAGAGARAVGVERSAEQIAEAERLAREDGDNGLAEFRLGDALAMPLADAEWGTFDLAHARFLLEHVADPLAVVTQMVRAVRPGGRIVLADDDHDLLRLHPEPPGLRPVWEAYQRTYDRAGNDPIIGRRLPALLHAAGAHPLRCTWVFFGACHGDPTFTAFLHNLAIILEQAIPAITATGLVDAAAITRTAAEVRALITRPGAALWYAMSWAEAEVRGTVA